MAGNTVYSEMSLFRLALMARELHSSPGAVAGLSAEPIAVIGMACRFPGGANSPSSFWRLLRDGIDATREVPAERWDANALYDPDPGAAGKINTRRGGFLDEDVYAFDPAFFELSPREAEQMDPQHRILLEVAWEALENAGIPATGLRGSLTGSFIGFLNNDYILGGKRSLRQLDAYLGTGNGFSNGAGRIPFFFDWRGPSMAIDTACSSSLVTAHLACQSLRQRECDLAIAGGVNLVLSPHGSVLAARFDALAPDGRSKAFDARADGYARGEGCGIVVLKRFADALADGDELLAVIRGSAINHGGRAGGFSQPNRSAHEDLIRRALAASHIEPHQVSYVETHGTGTLLGDPIEVRALGSVFEGRPQDRPLLLGALKANIGHLEAAAGVASLMKVVLALRHAAIPPHPTLGELNPHLELARIPAEVPKTLTAWPAGGRRIAGVSSFGLSGMNAHMLVEAAPARPQPAERAVVADVSTSPSDRARLFPLSARSESALKAVAEAVTDQLESEEEISLDDVAHTAAVRRVHDCERLAVVAGSKTELVNALRAHLRGEPSPGTARGSKPPDRRPKVAFLFSGHGSQWVGMGRGLLSSEPAFREAFERAERAIRAEVSWSVKDAIESPELATEGELIQPTLFAVAVALATQWRAWGIEPDALVGHSMGEVAAAHVAGALSLEDAVRVICRRSRILNEGLSGKGGMALIGLPWEQAEERLALYGGSLSIAAINSLDSTVISGETEALDEFLAELKSERVFRKRVQAGGAGHSAQVEPLLHSIREALSEIRPQGGSVPFYSTVYSDLVPGTSLDAEYWAQNARRTVRFAPTVKRLIEEGHTLLIEVSPHPVLLAGVESMARKLADRESNAVVGSLRRERDERRGMLESLATLYAHGYDPDWRRFCPQGRLVPLPNYPWQRRRFGKPWSQTTSVRQEGEHPLLGWGIEASAGDGARFWETKLGLDELPSLRDHKMEGNVLMPASGYVEMALAAARVAAGGDDFALEELRFESALWLRPGAQVSLQCALSPESPGRFDFRVASREDEGKWRTHARGRIAILDETGAPASPFEPPARLAERCTARLAGADFYRLLAREGVDYGASFQTIEEVVRDRDTALVRLALGSRARAESGELVVHPALLDGAFQAVAAVVFEDQGVRPGPALPVSLRRVRLHRAPGTAAWARATVRREGLQPERSAGEASSGARASGAGAPRALRQGRLLEGDVQLLDEDGSLLLEVEGFSARLLDVEQQKVNENLFLVSEWRSAPRPAASQPAGRWLISGGGDRERLARALTARGAEVVLEEAGNDSYRGAVYLGALDPGNASPAADSSPEAIESLTESCCNQALKLVQSVIERASRNPPRIWIVTRNAQSVPIAQPSGALPNPIQGALWGFGRTVVSERAELRSTLVDLGSENESEWDELAEELLADAADEEIALRARERFVARLVWKPLPPLPKAEILVPASEAQRFRADASYLISGGLGGLGLSVAAWMVEQGARHLMLVGRSGASSEEKRRAVADLERGGAQVSVVSADVSDRGTLFAELDSASRRHPRVRGVIHAAAVSEEGLLERQTPEGIRTVLRPKLLGALLLHEWTRAQELDFFVLYSSGASLFGPAGVSNYAAANAAVDSFAYWRRAQGLPAIAINWGAFAEVGGAVGEGRGDRLARQGMRSLSPQEGNAILARLLDEGPEGWIQIGAIPIDVRRWLDFYPRWAASPRLSELLADTRRGGGDGASAAFKRALGEAPPGEKRLLIEKMLREAVAFVLRIEPGDVNRTAPLKSLGMDSLMGLELKNRLEAVTELDLPTTLAWTYPTVGALAEYLREALCHDATEAGLVEAAPAEPDGSLDEAALKNMSVSDKERLLEEELAKLEVLDGE